MKFNNSQLTNQNSMPNYSSSTSSNSIISSNTTNSNVNSNTNRNVNSIANSNMSSNTSSNMSSSSNTVADDRAIMDNILSVVKGNCDLFMHGTIEASTPNVHQAFKSSLDESLQVQKEIFDHMSQKGWYSTQQAEQQKVSQTKQKFSTVQRS